MSIVLAVSIGCPCGIGPEVSLVAAARLPRGVRAILVGDLGALRAAARVTKIDPKRLVRVVAATARVPVGSVAVFEPTAPLTASERKPGAPGRAAGAAQLAWVDAATDLVSSGVANALVTGPVSKDAIARSGAPGSRGFLGHTEHLAARLLANEVTMAFYEASRGLTTSLVTTHLALARVPRAITAKEVARAVYWTADFVNRVHHASKSIAVASLNPHAGENGLLGHEETRAITPGIARARTRLAKNAIRVSIEGPVPAETAFRRAKDGAYAAVVAMYHDQATIPMKLLGFGEAVNVSLGLPIIRTSVDHGTAYDLAGKGLASPRGMIEAMKLARTLSGGSRAGVVG